MIFDVYSDGASSGNPGDSGIGCVIYDSSGIEIVRKGAYIGFATNNIAEYKALILAVDIVKRLNPNFVNFYLDSELVVRQIKREYRVKDNTLRELFKLFQSRVEGLSYTINHIPRARNKVADSLASKAKNYLRREL